MFQQVAGGHILVEDIEPSCSAARSGVIQVFRPFPEPGGKWSLGSALANPRQIPSTRDAQARALLDGGVGVRLASGGYSSSAPPQLADRSPWCDRGDATIILREGRWELRTRREVVHGSSADTFSRVPTPRSTMSASESTAPRSPPPKTCHLPPRARDHVPVPSFRSPRGSGGEPALHRPVARECTLARALDLAWADAWAD